MNTGKLFAVVVLAVGIVGCASQPSAPVAVHEPVYSSPVAYGQADDVLFRALGLVGTPYRWGGNTPESGFDCSGLIGYVYRDAAGISLPRSTREMINIKAPTVDRGSLKSGDLVFFATKARGQVNHAGIYVGEGRFVHAPSTGGTVRLDRLDNSYWQARYLNAKRVFPTQLAQQP